MVKHLPIMWETWVQSLGREDPLEKEMATHSSILAWKIPWTEDPGRLQSMGSQRVGHDWATFFLSYVTDLQSHLVLVLTYSRVFPNVVRVKKLKRKFSGLNNSHIGPMPVFSLVIFLYMTNISIQPHTTQCVHKKIKWNRQPGSSKDATKWKCIIKPSNLTVNKYLRNAA